MRTPLTIGGSQAAAACGFDPFCSRVRLWAELTGRVAREEPGEWALWGNLLEPVIIGAVAERGYWPSHFGEHGRSYQEGFMHGHPDGEVADTQSRGVLEVKTTGPFRGGEWAGDTAPPAYVIQCHWYMKLTGLDWSLLACLIGGQRLELRRIERDPEIERMMLAAAEEFVDFCERDTPPPPDGSDSTTDLLKVLYPNAVEGLVVEATADDYWTACELAKVKAQRKAVEQEEARLENVLKLRLEEADTLTYEGATIARWPVVRGERKPTSGGPFEYRRFTVAVKA